MPITEAIYDVLYNDKGVKEVIDDLCTGMENQN